MKHLLAASLLAISILTAKAQTASGIYLSAKDFNNGTLSFSPAANHKFRLRLNELLSSPYVTIIDSAGKHSIAKDSIFGYRSEGITYRLFKRESYEVLNTGASPLLYKRIQMHGGRGAYTDVTYYFSKDGSSPIQRLSRDNIRAAYAADSAFVEAVYDTFNTDGELIIYDTYRRMYRLNKLYQKLHAQNP